MAELVLVARLLLAGVFLLAGVGKLADMAGSRKAIVNFGIPKYLADPLGALLPVAEVGVALTLLLMLPAWYGGIGALSLLVLFIIGIGINLLRGRTPDCHCFGQIHSEPIGWRTLIRNMILAATAGFVIWGGRGVPGPDLIGSASSLTGTERAMLTLGVVVLVVIALESYFVFQLVGQQRQLLLQVQNLQSMLATGRGVSDNSSAGNGKHLGLSVGSPAPSFQLKALQGGEVSLEDLLAVGKPLLLLFTHPGCGPCQTLMPEITVWRREHGSELNIAVISEGSIEANRAKGEEHGLSQVLLQRKREVAEAYETHGTPAAVLVRPDGTIGSQLAHGPGPIWELMAQTLGMKSTSAVMALADSGLPVGSKAPAFLLPNLSHSMVTLDDVLPAGKPLLLLFVDPEWPPSLGLMSDIIGWQQEYDSRLAVVMISVGSLEKNLSTWRDCRRDRVLVQQNREVAEAYRAYGAPAGILIHPDGTIGSPIALGPDAIRTLVNDTLGIVPTRAVPARGTHDGNGTSNAPHALLKRGQLPPPLSFSDIQGNPIALSHLRNRETLLLFWNPACSFCRAMLDDLKHWEQNRPVTAPQLLVISTGTAEANEELGFKAPIVIDEGSKARDAFGAKWTPMAVLLDARGRVASDMALGAEAVLALAARAPTTA